jgi:plastocyanin
MLRRPAAIAFAIALLSLIVAGGAARPTVVLAGGGCHAAVTGSGATDGPTTVVRMDVCSFEPTVARVPVGTSVTFLNTAPNEHVVVGRGNSWGSELLAPGSELTHGFDAAGVYPFACSLHPGMVGAIVVGDGGSTSTDVAAPAAGGPVAVETPAAAGAGAPSETSPQPDQTGGTLTIVAMGVGLAIGLGGALAAAAASRHRRNASPLPHG